MDKPNLEIQNAFRQTFGTPTGNKVLSMLIERTGFLNYLSPEATAIQHARCEGERSVILFILEKLGLQDSEGIAKALMNIPVEAPEEDEIIEEEEL